MRPDLTRSPAFTHNYINQVPEEDLMEAFRIESPILVSFFEALPADKRDHRYAEGKWTIKEVLQHIIDAERIFAYRALCFARGDKTFLPGFDENMYADNSKAATRNWDNLIEELKAVRRSSELLFGSFDESQLEATGTSNNATNYVRAIGFVVIGHALHHVNVLRARYL
jgi:hypothetical protein